MNYIRIRKPWTTSYQLTDRRGLSFNVVSKTNFQHRYTKMYSRITPHLMVVI